MSMLPTEVLRSICEYAGKPVLGWPSHNTHEHSASTIATKDSRPSLHFLSLLAFSCSSRHFRDVSIPYLFRRLRVKTVEDVAFIVESPLLNYVRHLHLLAIDILTCRRPISAPLHVLVANVKSIRIASTTPSFYYTACTPLARLLGSAKALDTLELHCDPILESVDAMPLVAHLIPALPSSLTALRVTILGGQPEHAGVETFLRALSHPGTDHPLPRLNTICLSMHVSPLFSAKPEKLAIAIARRVPTLRYVTLIAPGRNPQRGTPLWDLIAPQDGTEALGGFRQRVIGWEFQRDLEHGEDSGKHAIDTNDTTSASEGQYWDDARMFD